MAASQGGFVVFQRGESEDSDAWDDTALIKAYDEAVSAVKAKLNGETGGEKQHSVVNGLATQSRGKKKKSKNKNKPRKKQKWQVGDSCRAVFTEDGYTYDAKVISINTNDNTCVVQYVDYGNEEEQHLSSLRKPITQTFSDKLTSASETESVEPESHRKPKHQESGDDSETSTHNRWNYPGFFPPPPPFSGMMPPPFPPGPMPGFKAPKSMRIPPIPPPPPFSDDDTDEDNEALCSMLISWYMNGYHTGYYQGLKQGRSQNCGRSSSKSGVR